MKRRDFIKGLAALGAGGAASKVSAEPEAPCVHPYSDVEEVWPPNEWDEQIDPYFTWCVACSTVLDDGVPNPMYFPTD